jgi:hypothetical protein
LQDFQRALEDLYKLCGVGERLYWKSEINSSKYTHSFCVINAVNLFTGHSLYCCYRLLQNRLQCHYQPQMIPNFGDQCSVDKHHFAFCTNKLPLQSLV